VPAAWNGVAYTYAGNKLDKWKRRICEHSYLPCVITDLV
jgi:hypothetical protein